MNFLKRYVVILGFLGLMLNLAAQETINAPVRTPEQEAAFQTEKMQKELNLSREQASAIYEINLKHARERQVSNSRSQALERVKIKDSEVRKVLTKDQYVRLQNKRYERSSGEQSFRTVPGERRNIYTNPDARGRTSVEMNTRDRRYIPPEDSRSSGNSTRSIPQTGTRETPTRAIPQNTNTRSVPQNSTRSSGTVTRTSPQNNNTRSSGSSTRSVPQSSNRSSGNNQPSRSSESNRSGSNERGQRR